MASFESRSWSSQPCEHRRPIEEWDVPKILRDDFDTHSHEFWYAMANWDVLAVRFQNFKLDYVITWLSHNFTNHKGHQDRTANSEIRLLHNLGVRFLRELIILITTGGAIEKSGK